MSERASNEAARLAGGGIANPDRVGGSQPTQSTPDAEAAAAGMVQSNLDIRSGAQRRRDAQAARLRAQAARVANETARQM